MTPTADDRGGSLFTTRREAGFLFGNEDSTSFLEIWRTVAGLNQRLNHQARQVRKEYRRRLPA
jgi:hypothetical protein